MFGNQRNRLLREDPWPDADALAQELYAMFQDGNPAQFPEGIALDTDGGPPITIDDNQLTPGGDTPIMRVTRGGFNFNISIDGNGQLQTETTDENGEPVPAPAPKKSGLVFAGVVESHLGGNVYRMTCYPNGRTKAGVSLSVQQLEGDPAFPHTAGAWGFVCKEADGNYCMILPVWRPE